jgi:TnpA family transposase
MAGDNDKALAYYRRRVALTDLSLTLFQARDRALLAEGMSGDIAEMQTIASEIKAQVDQILKLEETLQELTRAISVLTRLAGLFAA